MGETAPSTESDWTFQGNTNKTTIDVSFPPTVEPGAKVWFTAFFYNGRKQSGLAAVAVSTNLPGGSAMAVA